MNFWQDLKKPLIALAPMEDVTDCAFREIFAKYGKPLVPSTSPALRASSLSLGGDNNVDKSSFVMFTEFVNVDGLLHPEGFKRLKIDLEYTESQRPIVAQIWGRDPEKFYEAAKLLASLGFDGVDINMGCPQDKEIGQKTCAALIREPEVAGQIIEATIKGARGLPVSVKTRLGYTSTDEMQGWVSHLLKYPIAALTLHARTKQEKSKVPAHWEKIKEAVEIRNEKIKMKNEKLKTLIIGNGDVRTREELFARIRDTGADGVMVGRGAFGNPWIFRSDDYHPTVQERLSVMLEHAQLYEKMYKGIKSFVTMRKNFKAYSSGFEGASELRAKLMETQDADEVKALVESFLGNNNFEQTTAV